MVAAILFISFFIMLIIGLPIAICLGMSSALTVLVASATDPKFSMLDLSIIATNTYTGTAKFLLLAIPVLLVIRKHHGKSGYIDPSRKLYR